MSAIAILRPVVVRLAEGDRKPKKFFTIIWRGPFGDAGGDTHYRLERAKQVAKDCGAAEILVEDVEAQDVSPAPRLGDMTFDEIQQLREEVL